MPVHEIINQLRPIHTKHVYVRRRPNRPLLFVLSIHGRSTDKPLPVINILLPTVSRSNIHLALNFYVNSYLNSYLCKQHHIKGTYTTASLFECSTRSLCHPFSKALGPGSQWIHFTTKSTMRRMKPMHFMITKFALFHFFGSLTVMPSN